MTWLCGLHGACVLTCVLLLSPCYLPSLLLQSQLDQVSSELRRERTSRLLAEEQLMRMRLEAERRARYDAEAAKCQIGRGV
jgi:hypothetical protein